jgi:hypothetical protein
MLDLYIVSDIYNKSLIKDISMIRRIFLPARYRNHLKTLKTWKKCKIFSVDVGFSKINLYLYTVGLLQAKHEQME